MAGTHFLPETLISLLKAEHTKLHDSIACALVRVVSVERDWGMLTKVSAALRAWGNTSPEQLTAAWVTVTKEIRHMRRSQALAQLTALIPSVLSTFNSDEGPAITRVISDVSSWWP